jgi:hypothetical protein
MNKLKRTKLLLDALYWLATAIKEAANAGGELIEIWRKLRKK